MAQQRPDILPVRHSGRSASQYIRCSVCGGEYERGKACDRCGHDQPIGEMYARGRQSLISELQDFLRNPWGATALLLGVVLPLLLSVFLSGVILVALLFLPTNSIDDRLFNLALLFLLFLIWSSVVDLGIVLFVYFLRDQLYSYHWSWPVRKGRRPGIVQLAGIALAMFLVLILFTALLPLVWTVESPTVETFGLSEQYFGRGVLTAFLLSMSFASFVLFLMFLDVADYISRRDRQTVPPIYMNIDKLLEIVLDTVHKQLKARSSTLLSLERTSSGGLQLLLNIPLKPPGGDKILSKYEVESDKWGFLVSLKEKQD